MPTWVTFNVFIAPTLMSGRVRKQIGDAFMLVFDVAADAVRFGVGVCAAVAAESGFPAVHVGALV